MYIWDNGGFTLDGVAAKDLNIVMGRDSDRPIAPSTVDRFLSIPGRNGILSFGSDVGARYFNLVCNVITKDYRTLQAATERVASVLLDGYGKPKQIKLVFDARPDRYYLVKYSGSLTIDRLFGYGQFSLPLVTIGEPFARSLTNSGDGVKWGSQVTWGSNVRWGDAWAYHANGSGTVDINNWGTMIVKPVIEVNGSFSTLSLSCNGKTLNYNTTLNNDMLAINCESMTIKQGSNNMLNYMTGDFIELAAGVNKVTISGTSLNADVSFKFNAKYF